MCPMGDQLSSMEDRCHFADSIFKFIFMNENCFNLIEIWQKFGFKDPSDNKSALSK